MDIAVSNAVELYISPEVSFGQPAASPTFKKMRITGETLSLAADSAISEEIRSDRNRADSVRVNQNVEGDISFELSARSFEYLIQAAVCGVWSDPVSDISVLKNGTAKNSFLMQRRYTDLSPTLYHNFYGVRVDSLQLDLAPAEIINGSASVLGKYSLVATSPTVPSSDLPPDVTTPMNTALNVQTILDDGIVSTDVFNDISITIANNLRMLLAIGTLGPIDISYGVLDITGSVAYYFKNATMYNRLVADTAFSLSIKLQDVDGLYYIVTLPRIKLETAEVSAQGIDQDMVADCTWRAMYDPVTQCQIKIEKYDTATSVMDEQWDTEWI